MKQKKKCFQQPGLFKMNCLYIYLHGELLQARGGFPLPHLQTAPPNLLLSWRICKIAHFLSARLLSATELQPKPADQERFQIVPGELPVSAQRLLPAWSRRGAHSPSSWPQAVLHTWWQMPADRSENLPNEQF